MKRKLTFLLLIGVFSLSCSSKSNLSASNAHNKLSKEKEYEVIAMQDSVINFGKRYMSTPYRYGGTTPKGFDCSGFTSYVYRQFGFSLNRASRDQAKQFPSIPKKELQTGDLVFFEGRKQNGIVGHVGIVTERKENGEFEFLHSSIKRGVTVSSSDEPYYAARYLTGGRVIDSQSTNLLLARKHDATENYSPENEPSKLNTKTKSESKNRIEAVYHTVKKGDNLSKISKKYDVPITTIQNLNGLKSKKLKKGQRLLITEAVAKPDVPLMQIYSIRADEDEQKEQTVIAETAHSDDLPVQPAKTETKIEEKKTAVSNQTNLQTKISTNSEQKTAQEKTEITTVGLSIPDEQIKKQDSKSSKHKVATGETLYAIARLYGLTVDEVKLLNNLNSNTINAGQELIVERKTESLDRTSVQKKPSREKPTFHIVQRGETLYSISKKYKCTVDNLKKWNKDSDDNIRPGDKIKIITN